MSKVESYNLKNGKTKWKFRLYLGIEKTTGKEIEARRQGFDTKNEALLAKLKIKNEYHINNIINPAHPNKEKFSVIAEQWFEQYKRSVKENTFNTTLLVYKKHIEPYFGDIYVDQITVIKCQSVVNLWYETYTKSANLVSIASRIIKLAILWDFCKDNPFEKIMRPRNTHKKDYQSPFYNKNELQYFFECIQDNEKYVNKTIFRVLAYTGIRRAELYGLRWSDIDDLNKTLSIRRVLVRVKGKYIYQDPKTESSKRVISLDIATYNMLMKWKTEQRRKLLKVGINSNSKNQLIFTNNLNNHFGAEYANNVLKRILVKYNLPYLTIHGFRHTHCSLLFDAGVSTKNVQMRLGHSSIVTTMNIYNHVTKHKRDEMADQFARFIEM